MRTAYLSFPVLAGALVSAAPAADEPKGTQEAAAIEFINKNQGGYVRDDKLPGKPVYWVQVQGLDDADLEKLKPLAKLRTLYLTRSRVTDAGLKHLHGLTNLKELYLVNTKASKEGVQLLQKALPKVNIQQ